MHVKVSERDKSILVHLYTTHIHAEYDRDNDLYLSHRLVQVRPVVALLVRSYVQAYELSNFVRFTSESADISLVMGDLNLEPCDLGYKMVCVNGELTDVWCKYCEVND